MSYLIMTRNCVTSCQRQSVSI